MATLDLNSKVWIQIQHFVCSLISLTMIFAKETYEFQITVCTLTNAPSYLVHSLKILKIRTYQHAHA